MHKIRIRASTLGLVLLLTPSLAAAAACTETSVTTRIPAGGTGQAIHSAPEFAAAVRNARGGETFVLQPGAYGKLSVSTAFRTPVTIRSADPGAPACFTELRLNGAENVALEGLVFDYAYTAGDRHTANRFSILKSHDITISGSVFDGGHNTGVGHGRGLRIRNSSAIDLHDNVFRKWWKALTGGSSAKLTVRRNEFHDIRSDGMAFGAIDGLVIEDNHLHDFHGIPGRDHRDMLQIMRSSNRRSTGIVIRNNVFDMGTGDYSQTIWMGGDGKDLGDPMLRHQNVLIENNVIYNAHTHGISVHGIDNLSIRRNSVIRVRRAESGGVTIPRINVSSGSTYVVIEKNAVGGIIGPRNQRDWVVVDNAIIQDTSPSKAGYYDRQFVYYATAASHGYHEYGVRPGSMVDRLNAGSTLVRKYPTNR